MVFDLVYFDVTVFVFVIVSMTVLYLVESTSGVVVADTITVGVYYSCQLRQKTIMSRALPWSQLAQQPQERSLFDTQLVQRLHCSR
jgi:hypothetical protein